jgi:lysyl-tRNA synthetase class 1
MHWFDELAARVKEFLDGKDRVVLSAGLSVSGLQHIGRLRGEIILPNAIAALLRDEGRTATQRLVLYTQDPWKGTEGQRAQFPGDEGLQYVGWRLISVPDPEGCHGNWVDHHWDDFGGTLDRFAPGVQVTTTTDFYATEEVKALVVELAGRAEEVRQVVNKYRPRNPHPEGWLPFDPLCLECSRIGLAEATSLHGDGTVDYDCPCGGAGTSRIEDGKLNWRLEWPAMWKVLQVDVEPFGKDHATPGGSRDSCADVARTVMGFEPPFGIPYEWVGMGDRGEDLGDMASSEFLGISPPEWLEVADPETLRYIYFFAPVKRRVVLDLHKADTYADNYDRAARLYYGPWKTDDEENQARSYELALLEDPPEELPFQMPYRHAALLAQVAPESDPTAWAVARMMDSGMLTSDPSELELELISRRLAQSAAWVAKHAPENEVSVLESLPEAVVREFSRDELASMGALLRNLERLEEWREDAIKEAMVAASTSDAAVSTRRFFEVFYLTFLGKKKGPRAAPLLSVLDREFVLRRLREVAA